jgi:hypothetical protein
MSGKLTEGLDRQLARYLPGFGRVLSRETRTSVRRPPIATMCRPMGGYLSGYHAWTQRQPSRRALTDVEAFALVASASPG